MPRNNYTNSRGYHYVECTECGAKFNAGRFRSERLFESMDEWWAYHTGTMKPKYCKYIIPKDKIPKICEGSNAGVKEEKEQKE